VKEIDVLVVEPFGLQSSEATSNRIGSRIQDKRKTERTLARTNSKIGMALSLGD